MKTFKTIKTNFFQSIKEKTNSFDFNKIINNTENENIFSRYKILKLRQNEHFGDALMIDNVRSPLTIKTKSKMAEIYLMDKFNVMQLSNDFSDIFEKIYLKSSINMARIARKIDQARNLKIQINNDHKNLLNSFKQMESKYQLKNNKNYEQKVLAFNENDDRLDIDNSNINLLNVVDKKNDSLKLNQSNKLKIKTTKINSNQNNTFNIYNSNENKINEFAIDEYVFKDFIDNYKKFLSPEKSKKKNSKMFKKIQLKDNSYNLKYIKNDDLENNENNTNEIESKKERFNFNSNDKPHLNILDDYSNNNFNTNSNDAKINQDSNSFFNLRKNGKTKTSFSSKNLDKNGQNSINLKLNYKELKRNREILKKIENSNDYIN